MLVRPDATYLDEATKQAARIFPIGSTWLNFESRLPGKEVFAGAVMEPALGIVGDLALRTFANAEWQNWASSTQIATFELATRIGVPLIDNQSMGRALASVFNALPMSISNFQKLDDPLAVVPLLLKNLGLQVVQQLAGQTNMIAQVFAQVLASAVWAVDVVASVRGELLEKDVPLPPLQTIEPSTDTWQVNRVFEVIRAQGAGEVQFADGSLALASNGNYTDLFLPAYAHQKPWKIQWREGGIAAQQGDPQRVRESRGETEYKFDPGDASRFGFMPGAGVMLRVLQASYRWYATMRGNPVDRFTIRCRAQDRGCWQTAKAFDGSRDCRQCVHPESVWPIQGVGWAWAGLPLNATTPGENVGTFYSAANKLIGTILDMASRPGPLLYTVDAFQVQDAWKQTFEHFWEFMRSYWTTYRGWGWRGVLSRLATLMVAYEDDDGTMQLGGRRLSMPAGLVASPRDDAKFSVGFEHSIFKRVIEGYCADLVRVQRHYLHTTDVAYVPPGAGALYGPDGNPRQTPLAREFVNARAELLGSTKRMLVDLRRVVDPEYRRELVRAGVKLSPVNPLLQNSPAFSGGQVLKPDIAPPRAPSRPKAIRAPLLASANELTRRRPPRAMGAKADAGGLSSTAAAIGIALAAGVAVGGAAAWAANRSDDETD